MKAIRVWVWNKRFSIGWRILPGNHKHVAVSGRGEECWRCGENR